MFLCTHGHSYNCGVSELKMELHFKRTHVAFKENFRFGMELSTLL
jgi:hypothetical protein